MNSTKEKKIRIYTIPNKFKNYDTFLYKFKCLYTKKKKTLKKVKPQSFEEEKEN